MVQTRKPLQLIITFKSRNVFEMIRKIQSQGAVVEDRNLKYKPKTSTFYRQKYQDRSMRLLQQNLATVRKIQSTQPKIRSLSKKHLKSRSLQLIIRAKQRAAQVQKREEKLMVQNFQFIRKIENTEKKINCWADKPYLKGHLKRSYKTEQNYENNVSSKKFRMTPAAQLLSEMKIFQSSRYFKRK